MGTRIDELLICGTDIIKVDVIHLTDYITHTQLSKATTCAHNLLLLWIKHIKPEMSDVCTQLTHSRTLWIHFNSREPNKKHSHDVKIPEKRNFQKKLFFTYPTDDVSANYSTVIICFKIETILKHHSINCAYLNCRGFD